MARCLSFSMLARPVAQGNGCVGLTDAWLRGRTSLDSGEYTSLADLSIRTYWDRPNPGLERKPLVARPRGPLPVLLRAERDLPAPRNPAPRLAFAQQKSPCAAGAPDSLAERETACWKPQVVSACPSMCVDLPGRTAACSSCCVTPSPSSSLLPMGGMMGSTHWLDPGVLRRPFTVSRCSTTCTHAFNAWSENVRFQTDRSG